MKVLRTSDKIKVAVEAGEGGDKFAFTVSPMRYEQKAEIMAARTIQQGVSKVDGLGVVRLSIKYGLKSIEGVTDADGEPYELETETPEKLALTNSAVDEVMNMPRASYILLACARLINGAFEKLVDAEGKEIKGVSISFEGSKKK